MKPLTNRELIEALDGLLAELDYTLSGRSNMIMKTDLYVLRNKISELEDRING